MLISSPQGVESVRPQLPNVRELADSSVLASNVGSTLRLRESTEHLRRRIQASIRPNSQVIVISASDRTAERARQIAQEAAVVLTQLVGARFGRAAPPLSAGVLDPAHSLSGSVRYPGRDTLHGAGLGLLFGFAALGALGFTGAREAEPQSDDRELSDREEVLERRIESVAERERAVGRLAGELAARRATVGGEDLRREEAAPTLETASVPERSPASTVQQESYVRGTGPLNVNELERRIEARSDSAPEQVEQWRTYLFFLRAHAAVDGTLPESFGPLVSEVFGELGKTPSNAARSRRP